MSRRETSAAAVKEIKERVGPDPVGESALLLAAAEYALALEIRPRGSGVLEQARDRFHELAADPEYGHRRLAQEIVKRHRGSNRLVPAVKEFRVRANVDLRTARAAIDEFWNVPLGDDGTVLDE